MRAVTDLKRTIHFAFRYPQRVSGRRLRDDQLPQLASPVWQVASLVALRSSLDTLRTRLMIDFLIFFYDSLVFDFVRLGWPSHSRALVEINTKGFRLRLRQSKYSEKMESRIFRAQGKEKPKYACGPTKRGVEWTCAARRSKGQVSCDVRLRRVTNHALTNCLDKILSSCRHGR